MFYVFSTADNVYINTNDSNPEYECSLEGEFKVFSHAKELAIQIMACKVANYRQDYEEAKYNKAKLSGLTKKKVLGDSSS